MFCGSCGLKNEKGVKYCAKCGAPIVTTQAHKKVFYSDSWPRARTMAIAVVPIYDLMVDEENFYVIKLPASYAPVWGFFIGLVGLRIIGMLIGAAIGEAIAVAKRKSARNTYLDANQNLISSEYSNYIFLKIPMEELKHHIQFEKKFLVVKYNEGKLTLRKSKKQYAVVKNYLSKYVL